jgi:hypothetical protein
MKLLLVLGSDSTYKQLFYCLRPLGFEMIRYFHALKAMDNIDEIDPQAIIISAVDFPRHWKTMVQFFRSERTKDDCPIVILKGENFSMDDSSKASYIGVSGTIFESLETEEVDRLQNILDRHLPVEEKRRSRRYRIDPWQRFGFVFNHPESGVLVTGQIKDISRGGLSFLPDDKTLVESIAINTKLENCSLRAGELILTPVCRLVRIGRLVSMEFLSLPPGEQENLDDSLKMLLRGELVDEYI